MTNERWSQAVRFALQQDGVMTVGDADRFGLSLHQVARMVRSGLLERPERGILRLRGSEPTWRQRQRVALLRAGPPALVSHRAAAQLWQLEGYEGSFIELTVPRGHRTRPRVGRVFETTGLPAQDRTRRSGMAVTTVARTLVDIAGLEPQERVEVALDDALRRQLTTADRIGETVERLAARGRPGPSQLRTLLDGRSHLDGLTETGFETRLLRILRQAGLPRPATQYELHDRRGGFVMRFDAAYVDLKIGIEADSERWHMSRQRFVSDRTKRTRAQALDWQVLAFTHQHVTRAPAFVADMVAETRHLALRAESA